MRCPNCNRKLPRDSSFCESCGARIEKRKHYAPLWLVITGFAVLFLLCLIAIGTNNAAEGKTDNQKAIQDMTSAVASVAIQNEEMQKEMEQFHQNEQLQNDVLYILTCNHPEVASGDFKASKKLVNCKVGTETSVNITAACNDINGIKLETRGNCADVHFETETWKRNTKLIIMPKDPGLMSVTFTNLEDDAQFKILIVAAQSLQ